MVAISLRCTDDDDDDVDADELTTVGLLSVPILTIGRL